MSLMEEICSYIDENSEKFVKELIEPVRKPSVVATGEGHAPNENLPVNPFIKGHKIHGNID